MKKIKLGNKSNTQRRKKKMFGDFLKSLTFEDEKSLKIEELEQRVEDLLKEIEILQAYNAQLLADREALENENEQMENELFILREKIADIILTIQELNS
jgi:cell division protein FtsB